MKYLLLLLFLCCGCRMIWYASIGTKQRVDKVTVTIENYEAVPDPNSIQAIGVGIGQGAKVFILK